MRTACMVCGGPNLSVFFDCGPQPNGNSFLHRAELAKEVVFPLSMMVCRDCWEVQISEFPPRELLFATHPYITGLNAPVVRHFQVLAPHVIEKLRLDRDDLVVDVGCNDGTLLKQFAAHGMRVLGIDPSDEPGRLARKQGVTVFKQFWSHETGKCLRHLGISPEVITATAVFYHVPDLHDFVAALCEVMSEKSFFVVQGVNLKDLIENNEFDHFYHEHSCIHALGPLTRLFAAHGLRIQDVEFSPIHGGSFILYVCRDDNAAATTPAVAAALAAEESAGLRRLDTYLAFADRVAENVRKLKDLLRKLRAEGKTVYALGAPVKGSTLLNYAGIGPDLVAAATELNPLKIGRVMPGVHIPVLDESRLSKAPDYYLVLAWNFADFLIEKYRPFLESGGRFIVPIPDVRIVGPPGRIERL